VLVMLVVALLSAAVASIATLSAFGPQTATPAPATAGPTGTPAAAAVRPTPAPSHARAANTPVATPTPGAAAAATPSIVQLVQRASPSVVAIDVVGNGGPADGVATVSGVILTKDGLILTVLNLVEQGGSISVPLSDGRTLDAQVKETDPTHDLAIIKVDASNLPAATLGTSKNLTIGDALLVLGGPQDGGTGSVSSGIVSATNRTITVRDPGGTDKRLDGMLQTDAAISIDNEGGPLVDSAGNVVGIAVTAADQSQGIGFATPIDAAADLLTRAGVKH
jgi:S1-C subfamily serine protease